MKAAGPKAVPARNSSVPKGAAVRRRPFANAKAKVDTRRPRSSSPAARPQSDLVEAPAADAAQERKESPARSAGPSRRISPRYRSGLSSGSTQVAKEAEDAPQEQPRRTSSPPRSLPQGLTLEALQAENLRLKEQVERQRAEIQELRSQVPLPNEPMASYLGLSIPQVRSTTPVKAQAYGVPAARNFLVAAPCNGPQVLGPALAPAPVLTPRTVRVASVAEPTNTPRLYMPAYPSYAGQVAQQMQPQVWRFHSVGHTQTLG